jgi:NADH-quinone oxidoreductase subunit A
MSSYIPILILAFFSALVAGGLLALTSLLGPKRPTKTKLEPFESGVEPVQTSIVRVPVKFYIVAILFILFDIEIIFLFPWATIFRKLGMTGLIEMVIFLLILVVGLVYAWKKGALEWE